VTLSPCFDKLGGTVLYATGPAFFAMNYFYAAKEPGIQNIIFDSLSVK
jgi:hypothetical protein